MGQSTSWHTMTADRGLSVAGKVAYMVLNVFNNGEPYRQLHPALKIRDFKVADLSLYKPQLEGTSSPTRTLSNLFWLSQPWADMSQELGGIRMFDAGCGSGNYVLRLQAASGNRIQKYVGTDVISSPNWQKLAADSRYHFVQAPADQVGQVIPADTNFFISQSFLEHIPEDIGFFQQVRDHIQRFKKPAWQIHLFPSAACLPLYLWHGVRQYTPRTTSKIAEVFGTSADITLYRLGGHAVTQLHWQTITRPGLFKQVPLRDTDPDKYTELMWSAIEQDMTRPQRSPAFYALVIHHEFN